MDLPLVALGSESFAAANREQLYVSLSRAQERARSSTKCSVQHLDAIVIDQSAVGTSTRSNPATYTGVIDDLRKAFASANKVDAGLFSFNSKGACEACNGSGVVYTDLAFLDAFKSPCNVCQGRRFKDDVLAYKLDGKSISYVLAMTVAQAVELFQKRKEIVRKLQAMHDVGLAYLTGNTSASSSPASCTRTAAST